ncbi:MULTISPECIES: class I SAM-dependent methyltransferase [unclassified Halomonas]|uniref:class I SAM-dependent DNA methyltransferase n=1 Tax=unclassified Halomonas TaxID=2609666 RepID=UPI002076B3F4|nr:MULTISPECIES: class I SAM-dependent methyltransferase [unclassified Halomonas]
MNPYSDEKIVDSWHKNAAPWTNAVRDGYIESRKLVTDEAIQQAVLSRSPNTVLDIGCGEGWLVRELAPYVQRLVGVDAIPALVERAQAAGQGDFRVLTYEAIAAHAIDETFDAVVCNFSLLGQASVDGLFSVAPTLLKPGGVFIVQTLHPAMSEISPYLDGWHEGSWAGFDDNFTDPAPWYFRTLGSWMKLFSNNGLQLLDVREPIHPKTQKPASIIFIGAHR